MEYLKSTQETIVLHIWICWKWLGTNHKQLMYYDFNATLTCSVMDKNSNL